MKKRALWLVTILSVLPLYGCATTDTADLIEQAQITDDWSAVNERFERLDRAEDRSKKMCPRGQKPWCDERIERESCTCTSDSVVRDRLVALFGQ